MKIRNKNTGAEYSSETLIDDGVRYVDPNNEITIYKVGRTAMRLYKEDGKGE